MDVITKLEIKFTNEYEIDKSNAAEYAYAIATLAKKNEDIEKANEYALKAIEIYEFLQVQDKPKSSLTLHVMAQKLRRKI